MTLAHQGRWQEQEAQRKRQARPLAMILSCLAGTVVTEADVLGTAQEEKRTRVAEAQKAAARLEKKRARAMQNRPRTATTGEEVWQSVE